MNGIFQYVKNVTKDGTKNRPVQEFNSNSLFSNI